jgi:hypothetical protein
LIWEKVKFVLQGHVTYMKGDAMLRGNRGDKVISRKNIRGL